MRAYLGRHPLRQETRASTASQPIPPAKRRPTLTLLKWPGVDLSETNVAALPIYCTHCNAFFTMPVPVQAAGRLELAAVLWPSGSMACSLRPARGR